MIVLTLELLVLASAHPVLPVNTTQSLTQTSEWQFFALPESSQAFVRAEVWIRAASQSVALLARIGALPTLSEQGFLADALDESAWLFNKSYHFLQLAHPNNLILAVFSPASVTYDLKLTFSDRLECPRNCSGNGHCELGTCTCREHFLDQDCSLFFSRIQPDSHIVIPTFPHSWSFLAIDNQNQSLNLFVSVSPPTAQAYVYLRCAEESPQPPSNLHCIGSIDFAVDGESEQVLDLPCALGLVSMYNAGAEGVMLAYDVQPVPRMQHDDVIYVILAVAGVITVSWSCAYFLHSSSHPRVSIAQTDVGGGLDPLVLNTLFPAQFLTGARDVCAICLEPLPETCQVRVLPCKHVFNVSCIDQWFQQHTVSLT